jgi:hypothetical protein
MRRALVLAVLATSLLVLPARGAESQARVTIFAQATLLGWNDLTTLFGSARGAGPQDVVEIQAKECGTTFFRTLLEAHTSAGGGWTTSMGAWATTTFRAKWNRFVSSGVVIRKQAGVSLARSRSGPEFIVAVTAKRSFWRKQVVIQRRSRGGWETLRLLVLADSVRSTGTVSASQATFRLAVPRGTVLRAVLPADQARPCYVESASTTVRA